MPFREEYLTGMQRLVEEAERLRSERAGVESSVEQGQITVARGDSEDQLV